MKLFVFAVIIAVSAAARLEHLEQQQQQQQQLRAYLPPFGSFGSNPGAFGAASASQPSFNSRGSFPNAYRQYLPPDQAVDTPAGSPQSPGAVNGFGSHNGVNQQYGKQDAQRFNSFGPQGSFQPQPSANRQYLAPHSFQNIPQQPFDEQTGYHY